MELLKQVLPWVPVLGLLIAFLTPQVSAVVAWLLKRKENGNILKRNLELKRLDIVEASKDRIWEDNERLRAEADERDSRIALLENERTDRLRRDFELEAVFRALKIEATEMTIELAVYAKTPELEKLEKHARAIQAHVLMGEQITGRKFS